MSPQQELASRFRGLHKPGQPIVLANVYDGASASIITSVPHIKAVATASYAIAGTYGIEDADLTRELNLAAISRISPVISRAGLPLTVDLQDGYNDVASTIKEAIALGAVGCNIEDVNGTSGQLRSIDDAVKRVKEAVAAAAEAGVPDFVVNARTDALLFGGSVDDAIERGKAYLAAGAVTIYVWGGGKRGGITREEVHALSQGLGGRINVKLNLKPDALKVQDIRDLGVSRISVGPELYLAAMKAVKTAAEDLLSQ